MSRVFLTPIPLYGYQVGAQLGYNPHKPGRPSHTYHTFLIANLRLALDVEVQSGNQTASKHTCPGLYSSGWDGSTDPFPFHGVSRYPVPDPQHPS